ncbi:MAG: glycine--tRNA ligase subunit beta [OM182 bacterium MED-G28]|uniref:Glycine--tRNA ligase beta subunit n=1 Tax=OM182 bacterium MED-G28 TaxID=1986256 RepID=A0A2A5WD45_9GAMM|nr:MAG: glycine--tRNA ligase subunit beta [OM182 bacterium MED-G28]
MSTQDLLIEIGTEELPPKALSFLSHALEELIKNSLKSAGLHSKSVKRFATPRRLALLVTELDVAQKDKQIKRIGPALSAAFETNGEATPAALGFARSCGVEVNQLGKTKKEGVEKLSFLSSEKGSETKDLIPDIVTQAMNKLPVPKRMRWGESREEFVRPVHWIIILFGNKVLNLSAYGVCSSNKTFGHRFHHNFEIPIDDAADYENRLEVTGHVIPNFEKRKELIRTLLREEGVKANATTIIDEELLEEVSSLIEYPVALTGNFDPEFLEVPAEALILAMKSHQKCFYLVDANNKLLPKFVAISNIISKDPAQVIKGNERVIRPRLADARFFFEKDKESTLASRMEPLGAIVFQDKLGSVFDKSKRVASLAKEIAIELDAEEALCERAALLSKCDLITNMVGEFADLQGLMGAYYARNDGEPIEVCEALHEQYLPRFAGDKLPESTTGAILAIADKLDTMVGLFGIGQPPTGSKDPFALRRSAIGILRILVERELDLNIMKAISASISAHGDTDFQVDTDELVFDFLLERFRAWYQESGISSGVFQSVFVIKPQRPLDFYHRIQAVNSFNKLSEAVALSAANKRVSNLLSKQERVSESGICNVDLLVEPSEKVLYEAIQDKILEVAPMFEEGNYTAGLQSLSTLKQAVDVFFDNVLVMHEDERIRANRLALLQELRALFLRTADISYLHSN